MFRCSVMAGGPLAIDFAVPRSCPRGPLGRGPGNEVPLRPSLLGRAAGESRPACSPSETHDRAKVCMQHVDLGANCEVSCGLTPRRAWFENDFDFAHVRPRGKNQAIRPDLHAGQDSGKLLPLTKRRWMSLERRPRARLLEAGPLEFRGVWGSAPPTLAAPHLASS